MADYTYDEIDDELAKKHDKALLAARSICWKPSPRSPPILLAVRRSATLPRATLSCAARQCSGRNAYRWLTRNCGKPHFAPGLRTGAASGYTYGPDDSVAKVMDWDPVGKPTCPRPAQVRLVSRRPGLADGQRGPVDEILPVVVFAPGREFLLLGAKFRPGPHYQPISVLSDPEMMTEARTSTRTWRTTANVSQQGHK